jgi:hypothetical protein
LALSARSMRYLVGSTLSDAGGAEAGGGTGSLSSVGAAGGSYSLGRKDVKEESLRSEISESSETDGADGVDRMGAAVTPRTRASGRGAAATLNSIFVNAAAQQHPCEP